MPVLPTGSLSIPLHDVRNALVASPAWIAWCGDAPAASTDAYLASSPEKLRRPHAIVDLDPSGFRRRRDGQTLGRFIQVGAVRLYLCGPVTAGYDNNDAITEFCNRADDVLADLEVRPGGGGVGTVIDGIGIAGGPTRIPVEYRESYGDMVEAMFVLDVTVHP